MYVNNTESSGGLYFTNMPRSASDGAVSSAGFGEALGKAVGVLSADGVSAVSREDMTLSEYKLYISDRISSLPMSCTAAQDCIVVKIPDKGFENMQKDPEFEEWVINSLKYTFSEIDPWNAVCGGKYHIISFGTKQGQYLGQSWGMDSGGQGEAKFEQESKKGFWEHRAELTEQNIARSVRKHIAQQRSELYAVQRHMLYESGENIGIPPILAETAEIMADCNIDIE